MLDNYSCTKCGTHPSDEKEVFYGCGSCGNKLFKLKEEYRPIESVSTPVNVDQSKTCDEFTSIEVEGAGVYRLNVDKLFQTSSKSKLNPLLVSNEEGVYHIKLK